MLSNRFLFVSLLSLFIAVPTGASEPEKVLPLQDARHLGDVHTYVRHEMGKIVRIPDTKQMHAAIADLDMAAHKKALELEKDGTLYWVYSYKHSALRHRALAEAGAEGADKLLETFLNEIAAQDGYLGSIEALNMEPYRFKLFASRARRTVNTPEDFETFKAEFMPWITWQARDASIPWTGFEIATQSGVSFEEFAVELIEYIRSAESTLSEQEKERAVSAVSSSRQRYAAWLLTKATTFKSSLEFLKSPTPLADSTAITEAEMKSYSEKIPGTEITFKMVSIKGGKFTMGSPETEVGRLADEGPQHEVEVKPFWMAEHETTWEEFLQFAQKHLQESRKNRTVLTANEKAADAMAKPTPAYDPGSISHDNYGKKGYPASGMRLYAAQVYCKWLTALTGRYYRLPTEAEWEYACRAGSVTAYSFGNDAGNIGDFAWHSDNSNGRSQKVKQKKPNAWGLYDMHGNVAEWVLEQYAVDTYANRQPGAFAASMKFPAARGAGMDFGHIARGGHCENDKTSDLRSARRLYSVPKWNEQEPGYPHSIWWLTDAPYVGFRVVRPLEPPKTDAEAKLYDPDPEVWFEYRKLNQRDD
ncbi:MAG: formylglycine-generating enzyme family protein [Planctomycetaceae bacterium]|nr:formylglycine-generating enzyme family protein [Planctomycetaceae bacterium]